MILAIGVAFQVALGIFVHWYKVAPHRFQTSSGRGPSHFLHMILGVLIVMIGWATAWTGKFGPHILHSHSSSYRNGHGMGSILWQRGGQHGMEGWMGCRCRCTPSHALLGTTKLMDLAQFFAVAYVVGLIVFLPRQRRLERERREQQGLHLQRVSDIAISSTNALLCRVVG